MSGPLNINISTKGIDTSFPSLAVGDHRVKVVKAEIAQSKNNADLYMLRLQLETQEPAFDTKQKEHQPGFKFTSNITLPGDPNATPENEEIRLKSVAIFQDAVDGTTDETRENFTSAWIDQLTGKECIVTMKKAKDDSFGETEVKSYKPILAPAA